MEYHLCSFKSWLEWVCSDWHTLSGSLFAVTILLSMVFGQFHRSAMFDDATNVVRSLWVSNFLKRIWATGCGALLLTSVTGLLDLDGRQKSMLITFSWLLLVSVPFPQVTDTSVQDCPASPCSHANNNFVSVDCCWSAFFFYHVQSRAYMNSKWLFLL